MRINTQNYNDVTVIELQGEQREKIKPILEKAGYVVKIAGG